MKKFVLVMICTLIMVIFIGFNYLLWDRDNRVKDIQALQSTNEDNSATISALQREIKSYEQDNGQLAQQITDLNNNINAQKDTITGLQKQNSDYDGIIGSKNALLNILKSEVTPDILQAPVKKWVQSIDTGEFETAYRLQMDNKYSVASKITLQRFSDFYKNEIKSVKIKSIALKTDGIPIQRDGDIIMDAVLDVRSLTGSTVVSIEDGMISFNEGLNQLYFTLLYDDYNNEWVISGITESL